MADVVVTVPMKLWPDWLAEGDLAGTDPSGEEWGFYLGGPRPPAERGDRLYIVAFGRLRGYAPITRIVHRDGQWVICRKGGAESITIANPVPGFRGWRTRWWERGLEHPFPNWKGAGVTVPCVMTKHETRRAPKATRLYQRGTFPNHELAALCTRHGDALERDPRGCVRIADLEPTETP